jgi:hypothetical protein
LLVAAFRRIYGVDPLNEWFDRLPPIASLLTSLEVVLEDASALTDDTGRNFFFPVVVVKVYCGIIDIFVTHRHRAAMLSAACLINHLS